MSTFGIKIKGIPKTRKFLNQKERKALNRASDGIHNAGFFMVSEVVESIAGNRAEPSSVDTSRFKNSVPTDSDMSKDMVSIIKSDLEYAKYLEFGTSRGISPRRHFRNSRDRNKVRVQEIIKNNLKGL